jgi:hypothetical protein
MLGRESLRKATQLPQEMPNLVSLHTSPSAFFEWPAPLFPSHLTSLEIVVEGSFFDSADLPRTLTHFALRLVFFPWLPTHSKGLPKSLKSFTLEYTSEKDTRLCHEGYFTLPRNVTKLKLLSNNMLGIDDLLCFPKGLVEVHLPLCANLKDIDMALLPRQWQVMSLHSIEITGQTLKAQTIGDTLTIANISDSILPLLPPNMSRFWHHPTSYSLNPGKACFLSFERISLPSLQVSKFGTLAWFQCIQLEVPWS